MRFRGKLADLSFSSLLLLVFVCNFSFVQFMMSAAFIIIMVVIVVVVQFCVRVAGKARAAASKDAG